MNLGLRSWLLVGSVLTAVTACGGSSGSGATPAQEGTPPPVSAMAEASPPGTPEGDVTPNGPAPAGAPTATAEAARNSPEALAEARKRALKTAFHDVHEALLNYYAANARYPKDRKELETDPALAGAVAALEKAGTGLDYTSDGGSFTLTVKRADGPPLTLSGNNQKFRKTPPPAAETPAGT